MSFDMMQPDPLMFVDEEAENIKQWYVNPSIQFIALSYSVSTSCYRYVSMGRENEEGISMAASGS